MPVLNSTPFDSSPHNLARRSVQGGAFTLAAQAARFILQLGSTIILARLLTPEDYGLFAIVISIVALLSLFRDLGVNTAVLSAPTLDQRQSSAVFWINIGLGFLLTLVGLLTALFIADFFREPRLTWMLAATSSVFIFGGIGNLSHVLLNRQMRFSAVAVVEIIAMGSGIGLGIAAAWWGWGYWSLVTNQVVTAFVRMGMALIAAQWVPSLPQPAPVRAFIKTGGHLASVNILSYLTRNLDNLLIARFRGAQELGFYDKAYQLILLPLLNINVPLSPVAIATLSRLRDNPARWKNYFIQIILGISSLGMPLVVFLSITADQTFLLILGNQWHDSVLLYRVLAPAAFVDTFFSGISWVFVSLEQTARQLRATFWITLLIILGMVIGVPWGALGVAIAFSICRVAISLPYLYYGCRNSPVEWTAVLQCLARPAIASLGAGLLTFGAIAFLGSSELFWSVSISALVYGAGYIALWFAVPGGRQRWDDVMRIVATLRQAPVT